MSADRLARLLRPRSLALVGGKAAEDFVCSIYDVPVALDFMRLG